MKKISAEFQAFIAKGNVIDLAVGVIIGGAFGKIVSSLVNDILMPLIGILLGGHNFNSLAVRVNDATIAYGCFIQNVIDFFIIALCIFFFVKGFNKLTKKTQAEKEPAPKVSELDLLTEIRDLLQQK